MMFRKLRVASCQSPANAGMRPRSARNSQLITRNSKGFTLIELLVVIGIILILIGLFFAGAKIVTAQAKARDTRTMLETCQTMFANYQQATHLGRLLSSYTTVSPPASTTGTLVLTVSNTLYNSAFQTTPLTSPIFWTLGQEAAPGTEATNTYPNTNISPDSLHLTDSNLLDRPGSIYPRLPQAVVNTEIVMEAILAIPENQTILNNLPASRVTKDAVTGIPLLLDGWGNPILFCPAGGIVGVFTDPADNTGDSQVITSAGVMAYKWDPTNINIVPAGQPIQNQPFFVSAGPDGDVANVHGHAISSVPAAGATVAAPYPSDMTDDNIYSFNTQ